MVVVFALVLGSFLVCFLCSSQFISAIDYYMHREVCGSLTVYSICFIMGILFAECLQHLVFKEPPCDAVEAQ
jgi:hypothetical protein